MNKYNNGKIYKIISKNTDMIYIGSTVKEKLKTRLNEHKCHFRKDNLWISHLLLLWDDAEIKLIEDYPCNTLGELRKREQYWLDQYPDYIVNERKAWTGGCKKETDKKFRNSKKRKEYMEKYDTKGYGKKRSEWHNSWGGRTYGLHRINI